MAARENWTMAAIGGACGLLVTVVYVLVREHGVSAGEWLQFAGIFLGIATTIIGTLWLQRQSERKRLRSQAENLVQALKVPQELLRQLRLNPHDEPVAHVAALDTVLLHVTWARSQLEGLTYSAHSALETFMAIWHIRKSALKRAAEQAEQYDTMPTDKLFAQIDHLLEVIENTEQIVREQHLLKV